MQTPFARIPIIILCGGQGTRLRSVVSDRPKILAPFGTDTILDVIIAQLCRAGFEKIILSVGYLREQVREYCKKKNYCVTFSEEDAPLGTGGAIKRALKHIETKRFFVMNGDMCFQPDFLGLYRFHQRKRGVLSLFTTRGYRSDKGDVVVTNDNQRIIGWRKEDASDKPGLRALNAGTYLMECGIVEFFPTRKSFSLEREVFPALFSRAVCYAFPTDASFIDIGEPDRYALAQKNYKGFHTIIE